MNGCRKCIVAGVVASGLSVMALPPSVGASSQPQLTGAGKFVETDHGQSFMVNVSAHGTPADADGHVRFVAETPYYQIDVHGRVDCLFVNGNRATATGPLDKAVQIGNAFYDHFILYAQDNGEPGGGVPDGGLMAYSQGPRDCRQFYRTIPLEQGNIVIKD